MNRFLKWEHDEGKITFCESEIGGVTPILVPLAGSSIPLFEFLSASFDVFSPLFTPPYMDAKNIARRHPDFKVGLLAEVEFECDDGTIWISKPKDTNSTLFDPELDILENGQALRNISKITARTEIIDPRYPNTRQPFENEVSHFVFANYLVEGIARHDIVSVRDFQMENEDIFALSETVANIAHYNFTDMNPNGETLVAAEQVYFLTSAERELAEGIESGHGPLTVKSALDIFHITDAEVRAYLSSKSD